MEMMRMRSNHELTTPVMSLLLYSSGSAEMLKLNLKLLWTTRPLPWTDVTVTACCVIHH